MRAELLVEQIPFQEDTPAQVDFDGHYLGASLVRSFVVNRQALVMVDALTEKFAGALVSWHSRSLAFVGLL